MSREIRMAGYSPLSPSRFGLKDAGQQSLAFTVDWDEDGRLTESHSDKPSIVEESDLIAYRFDGDLNSLVREMAAGTPSASSQPLLGGSGDLMLVWGVNFSVSIGDG